MRKSELYLKQVQINQIKQLYNHFKVNVSMFLFFSMKIHKNMFSETCKKYFLIWKKNNVLDSSPNYQYLDRKPEIIVIFEIV